MEWCDERCELPEAHSQRSVYDEIQCKHLSWSYISNGFCTDSQAVYIYMLQPVYTDEPKDDEEEAEYSTMRRVSSCPNLSAFAEQMQPRKRAKSVFHPPDADLLKTATLDRTHSESDLSRIDRKRTFNESNTISRPTDILAQVVSALSNIQAEVEDDDDYDSDLDSGGVHGFSDSQILASEKIGSRWSIAHSDGSAAVAPPKGRSRAASDFRAPVHLYDNDEHQWTWSANNSQINEFRRLQKLHKGKGDDLYRASFAMPKSTLKGNAIAINITDPDDKCENVYNPRTVWDKLNPFKKRSNSAERRLSVNPDPTDVQKYLERTGAGRLTRKSVSPITRRMSLSPDQAEVQRYLDRTGTGRNTRRSVSPRPFLTTTTTATSRGRPSTVSGLSTTDDSAADLLENTTIGDLIRALEVAHTRANTIDTPLLAEFFDVPKRKMGTASMTPPTGLAPMLGMLPVPNYGRRGSMRPPDPRTPILTRANMARRQSNVLDIVGSTKRRMSFLSPHPPAQQQPSSQPPPYSLTPRLPHRRFSVRPTALSIPPGQAPAPLPSYMSPPSKQASAGVQRKISMIPSPLAREPGARSSVRFTRTTYSSASSGNATPTFTGTPVTPRSALSQRPRQGSMAHIYQRNTGRKRTESK